MVLGGFDDLVVGGFKSKRDGHQRQDNEKNDIGDYGGGHHPVETHCHPDGLPNISPLSSLDEAFFYLSKRFSYRH